jgi:hypothetical protein
MLEITELISYQVGDRTFYNKIQAENHLLYLTGRLESEKIEHDLLPGDIRYTAVEGIIRKVAFVRESEYTENYWDEEEDKYDYTRLVLKSELIFKIIESRIPYPRDCNGREVYITSQEIFNNQVSQDYTDLLDLG